MALRGQGRTDEAIAHFQRALEIEPDYAEPGGNLGIALAGRGQIDKAIEHYQKALVSAMQRNNVALVKKLRALLRPYEAGTPRPQPPPPAGR